MRFHQLDIGAQFDYQGDLYTKTTQLVAVKQADGTQKFMQRSAAVTPASNQPKGRTRTSQTETVDNDRILQAHERFYQTCMASIKNAQISKTDLAEISASFKEAHEQFLLELDNNE